MSNPNLSLSTIRKQKYLAEHPEARVATGLPRLDLRAFQTKLYRQQRAFRLGAEQERKMRAHERNRHRIRVRLPLLNKDSKPIDTATDAARGRLYFELPQGQVVRADRILGTRGLHAGENGIQKIGRHKATLRRFLRHRSNPLLVTITRAAVEANAQRKAA
jgi:hypothetical protein